MYNPQVHRCPKFSNSSDKITHPAPPITSARVNLPPGTTSGSFTEGGGFKYRSDHDIAAGIIPNSSNTRTGMNGKELVWYLYVKIGKQNDEKEWQEDIIDIVNILPPYVPAKSNDLKNISGSSNDKISGGINVKRNGKGLFSPLGSFSTGCAEKYKLDITKISTSSRNLQTWG